MTAIQICALIILILLVGIIYWVGYRGGLIDGRIEGIDEGKAIQQSDSSGEIRELQLLLDQASDHHKRLYIHYKQALDASKLGTQDRETLLAIAKQLKLSAETFSALKSADQANRATDLRDKALHLAALLEPVAQEHAA